MQRRAVHEDDDGAGEETGRAQAGDGTADDEGVGGWGGAADGRADLEDHDGGQEDPFGVEEGVDAAEEELEGGHGQEVGRAVPAHVSKGVEVVGDLGDGGGNDGTVLQRCVSRI